jgi:hypothetical protein
MDNYKKQSISINPETYIEIHHNLNLNVKPYLLKVFAYEGYTEHRLNQNEILNLAESLADFVFDNPNITGYDDNWIGLPRLWLHRRTEALDAIEELQHKLQKYEENNCNR